MEQDKIIKDIQEKICLEQASGIISNCFRIIIKNIILLTFYFQTFAGLILYAAQDKSAAGGGDFISFGLRSGVPEFRFSLGSGGAAVIRGRKAISFGQWHSAKISRQASCAVKL